MIVFDLARKMFRMKYGLLATGKTLLYGWFCQSKAKHTQTHTLINTSESRNVLTYLRFYRFPNYSGKQVPYRYLRGNLAANNDNNHNIELAEWIYNLRRDVYVCVCVFCFHAFLMLIASYTSCGYCWLFFACHSLSWPIYIHYLLYLLIHLSCYVEKKQFP